MNDNNMRQDDTSVPGSLPPYNDSRAHAQGSSGTFSAARLQTIELGFHRVDRLAPLRRPRHFRKAEIKQHGYSSQYAFGSVRRSQSRRGSRHLACHRRGERDSGRQNSQSEDRTQPSSRRCRLGDGNGSPRRKCHRPKLRSNYESQFGGISRSSECGCTQYSNRLCCRAGCNRESNRSKKVGRIRIVGVAA
jgi:hypothetical protein